MRHSRILRLGLATTILPILKENIPFTDECNFYTLFLPTSTSPIIFTCLSITQVIGTFVDISFLQVNQARWKHKNTNISYSDKLSNKLANF